MGAQGSVSCNCHPRIACGILTMKAMKAMKAVMKAAMKARQAGSKMTKSGLAEALAGDELKKSQVTKVLDTLTGVASAELKKSGVFTLPGVCRIKTRSKPATKAGKREIFGKMQVVKAKPARTVVKAFPVAALKS